MQLYRWMHINKIKGRKISEDTGIPESRISLYKNGKIPHEEDMSTLFRYTKGAVDANSYYGFEDMKVAPI
jgi:predicted XRE-type DNA-binding protein